MEFLVESYALEINAYAIMSNHFHLALHVEPDIAASWTPREVAERWVRAFPPHARCSDPSIRQRVRDRAIAELIQDDETIERRRADLASISHFMKHLKQPFARLCNIEDGCTGHFWEGRFQSGELGGVDDLIASLQYIDLNPHKAGLASSLEECELTSIVARIESAEDDPSLYASELAPVLSGIGFVSRLPITLNQYIAILEATIAGVAPRSARSGRRQAKPPP